MATPVETAFAAPEASMEMIALGLLVLAAHLGGRIGRRLRLSEVTGQLIGGAMVGPYLFHLLGLLGIADRSYDDAMHAFQFFVFVFLGMIAFAIGEELHISRLRAVGRNALIVFLVQSVCTFVPTTLAFWGLSRSGLSDGLTPMPFWLCALFGGIAVTSAPAVAFVLMNQLRVEGRLRHMTGGIVVLADLLGVLIFSVLIQIGQREVYPDKFAGEGGLSMLLPVSIELGLAVLVGVAIFGAMRLLISRRARHGLDESRDTKILIKERDFLGRLLAENPSPSAEILLVVMAVTSLGAGIAYHNHWPFLITTMVAGFMVSNFHSHAIFDSLKIDNITSIMNLFFFGLIGAHIWPTQFDLSVGLLAVTFIGCRTLGKLGGTWLGCRIAGEDRKIAACLPYLLLPQAGVAAVEAVYASAILSGGGADFSQIAAVVLLATVFFQIAGVVLVDRSLRQWRSWIADEEQELRARNAQAGNSESARNLLDILGPAHILLDLQAIDKSAIITRMVNHAVSNTDQHFDREQALQVLHEREELAPTGLGNGIALPHCRLAGLEKPVIILGRHDKGVVFGGVDQQPCHLIILLMTPSRDPSLHLKLLGALAHLLNNEYTRTALREAADPEACLLLIQSIARDSVRIFRKS